VVIADADHDEILIGGGLLRGLGAAAAELLNPLLRLGGGAIVDGDLVAAFGLQVSCHGVAHDAETQERNLRHRFLLRAAFANPQSSWCRGSRHPGDTVLDQGGLPRRLCMAVEKSDVLSALARVASPDGVALPATGKLSDVIVTDGKVFFSITVDAALVPAWEPVRKAAEAAVRAVAGVGSAMAALTGEPSTRARPP